jgi:hypothetical protein
VKIEVFIGFLLILFGFVMIPTLSLACEQHKEKTEIANQNFASETDQSKDCCNNHSSSKQDSSENCEGNCCDSNCNCSSSCQNPTVTYFNELEKTNGVSPFKKEKYFHQDNYVSGVFLSIWLPPKIG